MQQPSFLADQPRKRVLRRVPRLGPSPGATLAGHGPRAEISAAEQRLVSKWHRCMLSFAGCSLKTKQKNALGSCADAAFICLNATPMGFGNGCLNFDLLKLGGFSELDPLQVIHFLQRGSTPTKPIALTGPLRTM